MKTISFQVTLGSAREGLPAEREPGLVLAFSPGSSPD